MYLSRNGETVELFMNNQRVKIALPISSLFHDEKFSRQLIEISDCLECRNLNFEKNIKLQQLFHFENQMNHPLLDSDFKYISNCLKKRPYLVLISFHIASCYRNPVVLKGKYYPRGKKKSIDYMLETARINIEKVRQLIGKKIKIAVENNNYYPTGAYDFITDGKFLSELVINNKINFLLDSSHASITSYFKKIPIDKYINSLPMSKLLQIHLSKQGIDSNNSPYDAHHNIDVAERDFFVKMIRKYKTVKFVSIEYYKDFAKLRNSLKIIKKAIDYA